jgi:hypothetical protein
MKDISTRGSLLLAMLLSMPHAGASTADEENWPELSLGDLMKVGVESASRKSQSFPIPLPPCSLFPHRISSAPELLSIPEALRLAPGVEAARLKQQQMGHLHSRLQRAHGQQAAGVG